MADYEIGYEIGADDDYMGDDEIGARRRRRRAPGRVLAAPPTRAAALAREMANRRAPARVRRRERLGGNTTLLFTAGGATTGSIVVTPFDDCIPVGLTIQQLDSAAVAPGQLVQITTAQIGRSNQLAGSGPVLIGEYAPLGTTKEILWDTIKSNLPLTLNFATTGALVALSTILIAVSITVELLVD